MSGLAYLLAQWGAYVLIFAAYYLIAQRLHLVSFGHASCVALGMFMAFHLLRAAWPAWALVFLPLVTGGLCALLTWPLAHLLARFSGTLLAMTSLALAEIVFLSAAAFPSLWGDDLGLSINRHLLAPHWPSVTAVLGLIALYLLAGAAWLYFLCRPPRGLRHFAVRDNPLLAAHLGIEVLVVRRRALVVSMFLAGSAGALLLYLFEFVSASVWDPMRSVQIVVFSFLVGGAWWGPLLASTLWVAAQSLLPRYTQTGYLLVGLLFIAVVYWRARQRSVSSV